MRPPVGLQTELTSFGLASTQILNVRTSALISIPCSRDILTWITTKIWEDLWYSSGFSGWESLGGIITTVPKVTAWEPNRLDIVATGTDWAAYHKWWDGTSWNGWEDQGGIFTSELAITSWAAGRLDVFGRGTDNALYHKWFDGTWGGYEDLGGILVSPVTAVDWGFNRM